ncbi:Acyl transferase/acyl hydrolase/lysophospholipase [Penicillium chermesinum]|uniref:Acyl transferase/acyl hydrolase/lysophospholipase n=1 Tax=Penicillium chermesinum TaxID=63820 RepID=A0A9W9NBK8_9EURO|nr:Acyl transferase/acyl hydrolase/lysophospholipase [Penicillium chermesinum]KAJ5216838.1 Acyl transferase/acyl hydrolase/lysophospholipase [Penicillium chermesinum]
MLEVDCPYAPPTEDLWKVPIADVPLVEPGAALQPLGKDPSRAGDESLTSRRFFSTKTLAGFGPLQDGGVRANNPLAIVFKEAAILWPGAEKQDLLVSIGTGTTVKRPSSTGSRQNRTVRDSAIPRMIRAVLASPSMDAEQGFFEALNLVPTRMRTDIHRLDHVVPGRLPRLDDVDALGLLAQESFSVPDALIRTVLTTGFFFFEVDRYPLPRQGSLLCHGSILCKGVVPRSVVRRLIREFPDAHFETQQGQSLGRVDEDDGCVDCGYYRKKVTFPLSSREECFTIGIAGAAGHQRLGGFPTSLNELLLAQQAFDSFGRSDHSTVTWPPRRVCFCPRGSRRKVHFAEAATVKKRPRTGEH